MSEPSPAPPSAAMAPSDKAGTPRTDGKLRLRAPAAPPPPPNAEPKSTMASAGSNTLYANQAPFGTSVSRFSPSMTFAHQVAPSASRLRSKNPNRKWMPSALSEDGQSTLGELAGTPASDRLAVRAEERTPREEEGSVVGEATASVAGSIARSGPSVTSSCATSTSRSSVASSMSGGRPRSAGAEQKLSRTLRQEISELREQKLAAIREGGGETPRAAAPRAMTSLSKLEGDGRPLEAPLERVARVTRIRHAAPAGRENQPPVEHISAERASLLSFIAGEVRSR